MVAEAPVIDQFKLRLNTRPTHISRRDYDFEKKPRLQLDSETEVPPQPHLEDYTFPGQFTHRDRGKHLANRALERHRADYRRADGRSDQSAMRSGHFVEMTEHPRADRNGLWLLTEVEHVGLQPQVLEESITDSHPQDGFSQGYRNHFVATPWDVVFRPALEHPKPRITGNQHAVVTGPPGEEIYCDQYGRVKVQLLWDRDGRHNEQSSCWLRVATGWAHDCYGSVQIPRVGMEVLVGFTDGDPDKPVVVACLPNAATPVPLDLPAEHTRSIFFAVRAAPVGAVTTNCASRTEKGAEEIALRAQRDFVQLVLNDERIQVDNQRTVVIGGLASHDLRGEEHHLTHGNRLTELKQNDHLLVLGDQHVRVTSQQFSALQEIHLSAGQQIVINGGTRLALMGGGQWLTLGPEGIFQQRADSAGWFPAHEHAGGASDTGRLALAESDIRRGPATPCADFNPRLALSDLRGRPSMSLSTSLPEDLPWSEQQAFLLLDGTTFSDLPQRLKQLSPGASTVALYDCPSFTALRDISPLLVAVQRPDEPLVQFLSGARTRGIERTVVQPGLGARRR
ncbi:type VI secretion system tip protein TssI/VgrG [Pseudomonas lini]